MSQMSQKHNIMVRVFLQIKIPLNPPLGKGDLLDGYTLGKGDLLDGYTLGKGDFGGKQAKNS